MFYTRKAKSVLSNMGRMLTAIDALEVVGNTGGPHYDPDRNLECDNIVRQCHKVYNQLHAELPTF